MKFRIKYKKGLGFYAQVKRSFWENWMKIGKHTVGFGHYREDCLSHPMETIEEAKKRVEKYKEWVRLTNQKAEYYELP